MLYFLTSNSRRNKDIIVYFLELGRLNASWKMSSLAVNGQSFLVIDGYLLNLAKKKNRNGCKKYKTPERKRR